MPLGGGLGGEHLWDINADLGAFYTEIFAYACGFNEAEELEVYIS